MDLFAPDPWPIKPPCDAPDDTRKALVDFELALLDRYPFTLEVKENEIGQPYIVVVKGKCPLCYDDPWDDDIRRSLRPNSAYIVLASLRYRCKHDLCRAGGLSGYTRYGRPIGLPLAAVLKELGVEP